ncbi:MAG: hypothetical protein WAV31_01670 [Candidatus Moraniibacteriota bacterium]
MSESGEFKNAISQEEMKRIVEEKRKAMKDRKNRGESVKPKDIIEMQRVEVEKHRESKEREERIENAKENQPEQQELYFGPEKMIGTVSNKDEKVDQYGERKNDIFLRFEKGEFFVDGANVSASEFLDVLGGEGKYVLYNQRPELRDVFEKAKYYEDLRKKNENNIIDEHNNEKMQQSLRKMGKSI